MIFIDAGSSWCKVFNSRENKLRLLKTSDIKKLPGFIHSQSRQDKTHTDTMVDKFEWGTGHAARKLCTNYENDLISLSKGALSIIDESDFTVLDLGSRDAKLVKFLGRRPVKMDWSVGCAAATGATVEMISRFYDIDFDTLKVEKKASAVTCGTYALEKVMEDVANGQSVKKSVAKLVHGVAKNAFNFAGKPEKLYFSGGFTKNKIFLESLALYTEVIDMGRTMPLIGLYAFSTDKDRTLPSELPKVLTTKNAISNV